jgi:hypothetical protein
MREEIQQMRTSLNSLIQQGAAITTPGRVIISPLELQLTPRHITSPVNTQLSAKEDNTYMAMTRENSVEPPNSGDSNANGKVTVEEPMGSLYEVTRLRNIRSNRAKTARQATENGSELRDFISRGIISQAEAEDLYRRWALPSK